MRIIAPRAGDWQLASAQAGGAAEAGQDLARDIRAAVLTSCPFMLRSGALNMLNRDGAEVLMWHVENIVTEWPLHGLVHMSSLRQEILGLVRPSNPVLNGSFTTGFRLTSPVPSGMGMGKMALEGF